MFWAFRKNIKYDRNLPCTLIGKIKTMLIFFFLFLAVFSFLLKTAANSQTPSPAATFSSPRTRVRVLDTKTIVPTSAVTNFPYTSASTTEEPLCLNKKCQNGGSCQEKKCVCLERFAGVACEIYIGKFWYRDNVFLFAYASCSFENFQNITRAYKSRNSRASS